MITKNKVLIFSLCGTLFLSAIIFLGTATCYYSNWCVPISSALSSKLNSDILSFTLLFPSLFILSVTTYFLHEKVFRAWLHFAYWWIPLSVFFTLVTSKSGAGWGVGLSWEKGTTSFIFSSLFAIISLLLIIWKYFATRQEAQSGN